MNRAWNILWGDLPWMEREVVRPYTWSWTRTVGLVRKLGKKKGCKNRNKKIWGNYMWVVMGNKYRVWKSLSHMLIPTRGHPP